MGQYLSIGFARSMSVSEQSAQKGKLSQDEVVAEMQSSFGFAPNLYNFAIEGKDWVWTLKPEIWATELVPLLEQVYPLLYGQKGDWQKALTALRETPPEDLDEMLEDAEFSALSPDGYAEEEYLYFKTKAFRPELTVSFDCISIGMEGKISMESDGEFFAFFAKCIARAFPEHALAATMRVYITG